MTSRAEGYYIIGIRLSSTPKALPIHWILHPWSYPLTTAGWVLWSGLVITSIIAWPIGLLLVIGYGTSVSLAVTPWITRIERSQSLKRNNDLKRATKMLNTKQQRENRAAYEQYMKRHEPSPSHKSIKPIAPMSNYEKVARQYVS